MRYLNINGIKVREDGVTSLGFDFPSIIKRLFLLDDYIQIEENKFVNKLKYGTLSSKDKVVSGVFFREPRLISGWRYRFIQSSDLNTFKKEVSSIIQSSSYDEYYKVYDVNKESRLLKGDISLFGVYPMSYLNECILVEGLNAFWVINKNLRNVKFAVVLYKEYRKRNWRVYSVEVLR